MTIIDDYIIQNDDKEDIPNITRGFLYNRIRDQLRNEYSRERQEWLKKYPFIKYNTLIILPNFNKRNEIIGSDLCLNIFKNKRKTNLYLSLNISIYKVDKNLYRLDYYNYKDVSGKDLILADKTKSFVKTIYFDTNNQKDNRLLFDYKIINKTDELKIREFQLSYLIPHELDNYFFELNNLIDNYLFDKKQYE